MSTTISDDDAVELAEMLEFVHDLISSAPDTLADVLGRFTGGGYELDELRADLARFVFLLGGDSERLFGAQQ